MADETEREVGADVTEEEDVYLADFDRGYKAKAKANLSMKRRMTRGRRDGRKLT